MRFLEFCCALIAADFDGFAAEFDLDGISVELAIASGTCCVAHDIALLPEVRVRAVSHAAERGAVRMFSDFDRWRLPQGEDAGLNCSRPALPQNQIREED